MMLSSKTTVREVMSSHPHSVGQAQSLEKAHDLMKEHGIRHLPVLDAGRLVGMLSARDLELVEGLPDVDPRRVTVEEAMAQAPYAASPDALLTDVVATMAERKIGSAAVVQGTKLLGVLTTVDVCRLLSQSLREH